MDANVATYRSSGFRMFRLLALWAAGLCWSTGAAFAKPTKVFLHPQSDVIVAGGHAFGSGGAYEKVRGTVECQIDPTDPRNAAITDLDLAPRNADGLVSFDADYMLLYPADLSKWNHQLVSEINNRGSLLLFLSFANSPFNNDPTSQADFGNGFFLNQGFAMAWVGWGADVQPGGNGLTLRVPAPRNPDGTPVTQRITIELADEFSFREGSLDNCVPLSGSGGIKGYPAVLSEKANDELFVRPSDSPRPSASPIPAGTLVPNTKWSFLDRDALCVDGGFQTGMVYQLNYVAEDTRIMGLGYAAQREFASFLGHRAADDAGAPNPLATGGGVATSILYGASQSGVYIRDYVYQGFNEDLGGRRVFDAVHAHISGAVKLGLNYRFGQVHPWSTEHRDRFIPQVTFPFNFGVRVNPLVALGVEKGPLTDGILKRPATDPLFVQTDTSNEYWWAQSSLVDTDGFGHEVSFPAIPGVTYNGLFNALGELDFGPSVSQNRGIITNWGHPPVLATYRVLVPRVSEVGIDLGGVEVPVVGVPTATLTGWNLRRAPYADGELCELNGMFLPLPVTKKQAKAAGDPRPSLQELYKSNQGYVKAVEHFVRRSVKERFLLPEDADAAVRDAENSDVLVGVGQ